MELLELKAIYDIRKSFYNKALVQFKGLTIFLYSFGVEVARIEKVYINDAWQKRLYINGYYSQTTARHINEFLKQNGFNGMTKKEIEVYKNEY